MFKNNQAVDRAHGIFSLAIRGSGPEWCVKGAILLPAPTLDIALTLNVGHNFTLTWTFVLKLAM